MNSELSKESGENALADPSLQDFSTETTQNEELHSHRRSSKNSEPFEKWERDEMEELLSQLNGQLGMYRLHLDVEVFNSVTFTVVYPNHFLEGEDIANNFLFNADRLVIAVLECFGI